MKLTCFRVSYCAFVGCHVSDVWQQNKLLEWFQFTKIYHSIQRWFIKTSIILFSLSDMVIQIYMRLNFNRLFSCLFLDGSQDCHGELQPRNRQYRLRRVRQTLLWWDFIWDSDGYLRVGEPGRHHTVHGRTTTQQYRHAPSQKTGSSLNRLCACCFNPSHLKKKKKHEEISSVVWFWV